MTTMSSMAGMTGMAGMDTHGTTAASTAAPDGHAGSHGITPKAPKAGDPRFIDGSVGELGQQKTIKQKDGPAYGGEKVAKNQNANDRKQQNYNVTDANFTRFLGVIADPDTGQPQSYAETMQNYNAAGAIEKLFPDVYAKLVANQNAGRGTVLGGALAIFGITKSDGAGGASLQGIDSATIAKVRGAQLPGLGSLKEYVLNTRDEKGREWNRAHHTESHWSSMTDLVGKGWNWNEASVFTGDSMTSWAGRVVGTNNQDGDKTGFAADELAGLKYLVLTEQATGKSDILESVIMSHSMTHLSEDQLTNPKINKLIGLPSNFRPTTKDDVAMVAQRIRQWALQPGVQVNQGEFEKFVKAGADTRSGQILAGSGLLNSVQFKAEEQKQNTAANDNTNNENVDAETVPTGLGTAQAMATATPIGGGAPLQLDLPGSPTIETRPTLQNLGAGGPFPVIDPTTKKLDRALQEQLMTALIDSIRTVNDNPFLDETEEDAAFDDGAKKGVEYLKDAIAADPTAVSALKKELATALKDGKLSKAERTSLAEKLNKAGMEDTAKSIEDGTATDEEIATLQEKVDGAASAKLEKDISKAMEDGKLSKAERKEIESRLGKEGLDALEKGIEDGTVDEGELKAIAEGATTDEKAKVDGVAPDDAKTEAKGKVDGAKKDAEAGADKAKGADPTDPKAGTDTAKDGAKQVDKPATNTGKGDEKAPEATGAAADKKPSGDASAKHEKHGAKEPAAA